MKSSSSPPRVQGDDMPCRQAILPGTSHCSDLYTVPNGSPYDYDVTKPRYHQREAATKNSGCAFLMKFTPLVPHVGMKECAAPGAVKKRTSQTGSPGRGGRCQLGKEQGEGDRVWTQ